MKQIKFLFCLCLFIVSTISESISIKENVNEKDENNSRAITTANMNMYMDIVMIQVGPWMNSNLIPMAMPDVTEEFSAKPILVTYYGELVLTNGHVHRMDQVRRSGNAYMIYDRQMLRIQVVAEIRNLEFTYDYSASIWDLGPNGWADGKTDSFIIECDFLVDLYDFYVFIQNFNVKSLGNIDINLRGNILVDWLYGAMINTMTTIFHRTITEFVSDRIKLFVQATVDEMNRSRFSKNKQFDINELMNIFNNIEKHL